MFYVHTLISNRVSAFNYALFFTPPPLMLRSSGFRVCVLFFFSVLAVPVFVVVAGWLDAVFRLCFVLYARCSRPRNDDALRAEVS